MTGFIVGFNDGLGVGEAVTTRMVGPDVGFGDGGGVAGAATQYPTRAQPSNTAYEDPGA